LPGLFVPFLRLSPQDKEKNSSAMRRIDPRNLQGALRDIGRNPYLVRVLAQEFDEPLRSPVVRCN
jgi:hypothetical protein